MRKTGDEMKETKYPKYSMKTKKKFKAIFGNPPYSMKTGVGKNEKKLLWNRFSETSIEMADEVYYVTPYIWNGNARGVVEKNDTKIRKVDFTAGEMFDVGSSICYWNNAKADEGVIETKNKKIKFDRLSEIIYVPFDLENTLSIHRKGWAKKPIGFKAGLSNIMMLKYEGKLKPVKDDEFKHPVYSTSIHRLYYTNEVGYEMYENLYGKPKIMVGRSSDNAAFFDRDGELAATHMASCLFDTAENLEIRFKQLTSKFTKFWFQTSSQEMNGKTSAFVYHAAYHHFPDIPLSITTDDEIHDYFELSDDEVKVVEKYAHIATESEKRRVKRAGMVKKAVGTFKRLNHENGIEIGENFDLFHQKGEKSENN